MWHIILWLIVVTILAVPFLYILFSSPTDIFWDSAFSSLFGTAAALIGGIPIALSIDRVIKKREAEKVKTEKNVYEKGLLRLIKEELEECRKSLTARIASTDAVITKPIRSSFWHAASLGGKLNYISNHVLLSKISTVYHQIDVIQNVEMLCFKACNSATVSFSNGTTAARNLLEHTHSFYGPLNGSLNEIIPLIDSHINSLK